MDFINGFSKLSKDQKRSWVDSSFESDHLQYEDDTVYDELCENTIDLFKLPFNVAPNFLIDNKVFCIPMVIEESSVVAAASRAAKFWSKLGGFKTEIFAKIKEGNVHFFWTGDKIDLESIVSSLNLVLSEKTSDLTKNMDKRGGGIQSLELVDCTGLLNHYYKLEMKFLTCEAMGANFINSVLERVSELLSQLANEKEQADQLEISMSILSNFTDSCLVKVSLNCELADLDNYSDAYSGEEFARKFVQAVDIARVDAKRAVTHNKGIMNGIDAVVLATGNDFRAIEACAHAYAARNGRYSSLSHAFINGDSFHFEMTIPLALGTVGGLTSIHPKVKYAFDILGNPNVDELMSIVASAGLAQNFGAVSSLVTTGIQKGHMKMHLLNILRQLNATDIEIRQAKKHFEDKVISFSYVRDFLNSQNVTQ